MFQHKHLTQIQWKNIS